MRSKVFRVYGEVQFPTSQSTDRSRLVRLSRDTVQNVWARFSQILSQAKPRLIHHLLSKIRWRSCSAYRIFQSLNRFL
jgi:hypothetical protein